MRERPHELPTTSDADDLASRAMSKEAIAKWRRLTPAARDFLARAEGRQPGFGQHHVPHPMELRAWDVPCDLFWHPEHLLGVAVHSRPAALANQIDNLCVSRAPD
jgi:hypothetical protein